MTAAIELAKEKAVVKAKKMEGKWRRRRKKLKRK